MANLLTKRIAGPTSILVSELAIIFIWASLNIVIFVWQMLSMDSLTIQEDITRSFGHNVLVNLGFQLLPIARNSIWLPILGIPFEKLVKYHRMCGRATFFCLTVHMVGWYVVWFMAAKNINISSYIASDLLKVVYGSVAWFTALVMLILALERIRRMNFELFYYSHHLFIVFFVFTFLHCILVQSWPTDDVVLWYCLPGFLLYLIDRGVRFVRSRMSGRYRATLRCTGRHDRLVRLEVVHVGGKRFAHSPGQYCFINVPCISKLEWHPFTISSASDDAAVTFHIKDMGSGTWTDRLCELGLCGPATEVTVLLDGPYGASHLSGIERRVDTLVCVAGGIGITPVHSVLRYLQRRGTGEGVRLRDVHVVWALRYAEAFVDISGFLSQLEAAAESSASPAVHCHYYVTGLLGASPASINAGEPNEQTRLLSTAAIPADTVAPPHAEQGRPHIDSLFESLAIKSGACLGVIVCGPSGLTMAVKAAVNKYHAKNPTAPRIQYFDFAFFL